MTPVPRLIEGRELVKTYRMDGYTIRAIGGVNIHIARSEFVAVLGPSGSGKSTLMHVLGGLDRPDMGSVLIEGQDLYALSSDALADFRYRHIGFIFQAYNLIPRLTALENVELPLAIAGLPRDESLRQANTLLDRVGLSHRVQHRPLELSGGEQQRVAIARALVNAPRIVFADEPTGNLDSRTGKEIVHLMKALNDEQGVTFLLVTHDPRIAELSDRILTLEDGVIAQSHQG